MQFTESSHNQLTDTIEVHSTIRCPCMRAPPLTRLSPRVRPCSTGGMTRRSHHTCEDLQRKGYGEGLRICPRRHNLPGRSTGASGS